MDKLCKSCIHGTDLCKHEETYEKKVAELLEVSKGLPNFMEIQLTCKKYSERPKFQSR